jgi:hypothetical protein
VEDVRVARGAIPRFRRSFRVLGHDEPLPRHDRVLVVPDDQVPRHDRVLVVPDRVLVVPDRVLVVPDREVPAQFPGPTWTVCRSFRRRAPERGHDRALPAKFAGHRAR